MNKLLDYAYAGLLHDIGKFYQRTESKSNLNAQELDCTPIHNLGYHTHLHSGYTSKFFKNYLLLNNQIEAAASEHHKNDEEPLHKAVRESDRIASKVDRNDETKDNEADNKKKRYITSRLHSIMCDIDFGKELEEAQFDLSSIDQLDMPYEQDGLEVDTAIQQYKELFEDFVNEVNYKELLVGDPTPFKFHRFYSLLYKYTSMMPASSYETNRPTVSLFDHLKLTAAISSCKYYTESDLFYMLEFDVSGIQKFIYAITESDETRKGIAKALRGRSILVSLITNAISYAILNEFELTQANIIFNTGGGGLLLLPHLDDTKARVEKVCTKIQKDLYQHFHTDLTFVYAMEELTDDELEAFKAEKELTLKTELESRKKQKYVDIIDDGFYFESYEGKRLCAMCGQNEAIDGELCPTCTAIEEISNFYIQNNSFSIRYHFNDHYKGIDLGFVNLELISNPESRIEEYKAEKEYFYIDAINHYRYGNVKLNANLVARDGKKVLNFEDIAQKLPKDKFGDQKLAILKMDVDNLGAVFAFGLKNSTGDKQRALSKYLTLSRLFEFFFSIRLKQICEEVSQDVLGLEDNIFYINYAGGDDLVIIGPVFGIVQLAAYIRSDFKDYVNNPNITLSGGIHIQAPKKPIRFGIQSAEEQLEMSKHYNNKQKDALTIMNTTVAFDEIDSILNKITKYREEIQKENVTRTSFYTIMSHLPEHYGDAYFETIPKIQYVLFRQLGERSQLRIDLLNDITKATNEYELKKVILIMKLVILFTREA